MNTIINDSPPASKNTTRNYSHSNQSTATIEVQHIVPGDAPGVLAVVTVKVGGVLIRGVKVCNRGRGTFINFPARKFDGEWIDLVEISSPALRTAIVDVILAAVRELQVQR